MSDKDVVVYVEEDKSWLGYGLLATTLASAVFTGLTNAKMGQLAKAQADARAQAAKQADLRHLIMDIEPRLAQFENDREGSPGEAFAFWHLGKAFEIVGLTSRAFTEFVDLDRVKPFFEKFQRLKEQSRAELGEKERAELDRMTALSPHRDELVALIADLDARENLAQTEKEWTDLQEERKRRRQAGPARRIALYSLLALVVSLIVACVSLTAGSVDSNGTFIGNAVRSVGSVIFSINNLCLMAAGLLFPASLIAYLFGGAPPGYGEMQRKRAGWQAKLLASDKASQTAAQFGGEGLGIAHYQAQLAAIHDYHEKALPYIRKLLPEALLAKQ